jgi:hypothetical protein
VEVDEFGYKRGVARSNDATAAFLRNKGLSYIASARVPSSIDQCSFGTVESLRVNWDAVLAYGKKARNSRPVREQPRLNLPHCDPEAHVERRNGQQLGAQGWGASCGVQITQYEPWEVCSSSIITDQGSVEFTSWWTRVLASTRRLWMGLEA